MDINFIVNNQKLSRNSNNFIVQNSQNYLSVKVEFKTDDWNGFTKYVCFENEIYNRKNNNALISLMEKDIAKVPNEIAKEKGIFNISVFGELNGVRITTNKREVEVNASGCICGTTSDAKDDNLLNESIINVVSKFDDATGTQTLTFTKIDGTTFDVVTDFPTENLIKSASIVEKDGNQYLELVFENDNVVDIPLDKFLNVYQADETTLTLNNGIFSIKQDWILNTITNPLNNKVDKVTGKGLSTNDFTNEYKSKLDNLSVNYVEKKDGYDLVSDSDIVQITTNKNDIVLLKADNITTKSDISLLKTDNETNKSNIEQLDDDTETISNQFTGLVNYMKEVIE